MRKKKRTLSLDTRKRPYEVSIAGIAVAVGTAWSTASAACCG